MLLQPLSATSARPVVHLPMLIRQQVAEPSADIVALVESKHAMTFTLEVYFRPLPPPVAPAHAQDSFVSAMSLQRLQVSSAEDASLQTTLEERTADYTVKRSLAELKKFRADIQHCLGKGEHCAMCKKIATYMSYCWERPRLLNRTWNGAVSYHLDVLAKFVNLLLRYASQLGVDGPEASECHAKFGSIVSTFLQQNADKDDA